MDLRCCNVVVAILSFRDVCVEIGPELDEEEGVCRPLLVELLESALLFRELVLDLPDVDGLQHGLRRGHVPGTPNVHKQVLVVSVMVTLLLYVSGVLE